jgi:hypothetical protein
MNCVGSEVLTVVVISCDITLKVNRHFGGTRRHHLHGRRIRQARNQRETGSKLCWFLAGLPLQTRRWTRRVAPKGHLTFNGLHTVISQRTELLVFVFSLFTEIPVVGDASDAVIHSELYVYNTVVSFLLVTWPLNRAYEEQIDRDFTTSTDLSMQTKYTGAWLVDREFPAMAVIYNYNACKRLW